MMIHYILQLKIGYYLKVTLRNTHTLYHLPNALLP